MHLLSGKRPYVNSSKMHAMNQQAMRKEGVLQPILPDPLPIALETVLSCWVAVEMGALELGMSELGVMELGMSELGVMELGMSELGVSELGVMGCVVMIVGGSVTSHTASFGPPQSCARS